MHALMHTHSHNMCIIIISHLFKSYLVLLVLGSSPKLTFRHLLVESSICASLNLGYHQFWWLRECIIFPTNSHELGYCLDTPIWRFPKVGGYPKSSKWFFDRDFVLKQKWWPHDVLEPPKWLILQILNIYIYIYISGWWFGTLFLFMNFHILGIITPTDFSIFFRGDETTNQKL